MRVTSMAALAVTVAVVLLARCCDGSSLRGLALNEEEEELRPAAHGRLYRDYGVLHRSIRDDDAFDDYGHLRFGRSDE